jgi:catechol 2,3-dioxygenase-like lactoylglutathione lyase family enzyme
MASAQAKRPPPPPTHILETALQVRDVAASTKFYRETLGVEPALDTPRMSVFPLGQTTLLLFQLGATASDSTMPDNRGVIPGHGPSEDILSLLLPREKLEPPAHANTGAGTSTPGTDAHLKQHFCLAVPSVKDVQAWEAWLADCGSGVRVTATVDWPRGGRSVYFADLDGNVGEIGSRGIWNHY